MSSKNT